MAFINKEKTILLPKKLDRKVVFKGNDHVSDSYLEMMTNYFTSKLLTYNKSNASYQFSEVLRYVEPSIYPILKIKFDKDIERIKRDDVGNVFYPLKIHISKQKKAKYIAKITGEERSYVGTQQVKKLKKDRVVTYKFTYRYKSGIFSLMGYELIKENARG